MIKNQLRTVLYALKRPFGTRALLYSMISQGHNIETGKSVKDWITVQIKKLILLPENKSFDFSRLLVVDPSSIGNLFEKGKRFAIVDSKEATIKLGDHLVINTVRYEVENCEMIEDVAQYIKLSVVK